MADPKIRSNRADGRAVISGMEVMSLRRPSRAGRETHPVTEIHAGLQERDGRKSMNGMSRTRLRWAVRRPSVYAARLRAHEIIVRTGPSEGEEDE